jgi:hypothetical protein
MRKMSRQTMVSLVIAVLSVFVFTTTVDAKKKPRKNRRAKATRNVAALPIVFPIAMPTTEVAQQPAAPAAVDSNQQAGESESMTGAPTPVATSIASTVPLRIAEFRTRGPNGKFDEFVKFYNSSNSDYTVQTADGSAGFALVALSGSSNSLNLAQRFTIPNGTVIPAHGHYLAALANTGLPQQNGYSLNSYAAPDIVYGTDIDDDRGIALFDTANSGSWVLDDRIDAVGFNTSAQAAAQLTREGTALASAGSTNGQYSWVRKINKGTILPIDTDNNANDFIFVSNNGGIYGAATSVLGYPGPQNLDDPRDHQALAGALVPDGTSPTGFKQNLRSFTPAPNANFGTLTIYRRITNVGSNPITKLRFRVVDMTTYNSPTVNATQADLRLLSSAAFPVGEPKATVLDAGADQPSAGGWNSSANVEGSIDLNANPLLPGQYIDVRFVLGVQTNGFYRFYLAIESK